MSKSKPIQIQTKAERRRLELAEMHLAMASDEIRLVEGLAARFGATRTLAEVTENWRRRRTFWAKQVVRLGGNKP